MVVVGTSFEEGETASWRYITHLRRSDSSVLHHNCSILNSTTTTFQQHLSTTTKQSTCLTPCARDSASRLRRRVSPLTFELTLYHKANLAPVTPDSQKSTFDKASENVSGLGDKAASAVQPEGQKSTTQKVGDSTRSGGDSAQKEGGGILGSAQEGLQSAGQSISDTFNSATDNKK